MQGSSLALLHSGPMAGRETLALALATASISLDERLVPSEADQLQSIALKWIRRFASRNPLYLRTMKHQQHLSPQSLSSREFELAFVTKYGTRCFVQHDSVADGTPRAWESLLPRSD